jgi:hypothetical protein
MHLPPKELRSESGVPVGMRISLVGPYPLTTAAALQTFLGSLHLTPSCDVETRDDGRYCSNNNGNRYR